MSLRARLTIAAATAVAIAIALASVIVYVSVRDRLFDEADATLRARAAQVRSRPGLRSALDPPPAGRPRFPRLDQYVQVLRADGAVGTADVALPVTAADRDVARTQRGAVVRDITVGGERLRMLTVPTGVEGRAGGLAVQVARPLAEIDNTLSSLRVTLLVVALGGTALAGVLGLAIARTTLRPVARLTEAAEHVAETQDLDASIAVGRDDELGRLATSFNTMLAAIAASREQQAQLVADASHELRTPLTSVRTNIEVLARQRDMPAEERDRLLRDVTTQMEELTLLVGDLVELARGDAGAFEEEPAPVRVDRLVERAVARANLHAHGVQVRLVATEPRELEGRRHRLERALANVLDNACAWSDEGAVVEVRQEGDDVTVRDHGPGIDAADLPHVFDRFYRAPGARARPGSGLGLAIVRAVVDQHGGTATAAPAPGGGTIVTLHLPSVPVG